MAGPAATIAVAIIGNADKLNAALNEGAENVNGFSASLGGIVKGAAVAGAVTAVAATVVDLTEAAADDAAEQARLEQAISASGAAVGDWQAQTEAAIAAGQSLAFTDTQIRDAMVPLVGATGDVAQATDLLSTAQDIARLKNVDLATAAEAVAKSQDCDRPGALGRRIDPGPHRHRGPRRGPAPRGGPGRNLRRVNLRRPRAHEHHV
jgi:hypothetical protein